MIDENLLKHFLESVYFLRIDSFEILRGGVINENYLVRAGEKKFVCKCYLLRVVQQVDYEVNILLKLSALRFPCTVPQMGNNGLYVQNFEEKPLVLYDFIDGAVLETWDQKIMAKVGSLIGMMHSALRDCEQLVERDVWDQQRINFLAEHEVGEVLKKKFIGVEDFLQEILYVLRHTPSFEHLPRGTTHQDVKPSNIICDENGALSFIDFDNVCRDVLLIDTMTPLIWMAFDGEQWNEQFVFDYLQSYISYRPLHDDEKKVAREALLYRCAREAFVWAYRFNTDEAWHTSLFFLRAVRALRKSNLLVDFV